MISKVVAPAAFAVMQDAKGTVRAANNELLKRMAHELGPEFWELTSSLPQSQKIKLRQLLG